MLYDRKFTCKHNVQVSIIFILVRLVKLVLSRAINTNKMLKQRHLITRKDLPPVSVISAFLKSLHKPDKHL